MLTNYKIQIFCVNPALQMQAQRCAEACGLSLNQALSDAHYQLDFDLDGVSLRSLNQKKHGQIQVDFCEGKNAHRRKFGGGKSQLIAKACGVKGTVRPHILDATAGLGQDGFVLATLGCKVTLLERSPIACALLENGLARAHAFARETDAELLAIVERMTLIPGNSIQWLQQAGSPVADVIYLDPMFPDKQKSAAVNKNMQAFHNLIGKDEDDDALLLAALARAHKRVVVKRPRLAPAIAGPKPSYALEGKSSRYDIYALQKMEP